MVIGQFNGPGSHTGGYTGRPRVISDRQVKGFRNPLRFVSTPHRQSNDLRAPEPMSR
jgi:hypothetical protein